MTLHRLLEDVKKSLRPDDTIKVIRDEIIENLNKELTKRDIKAKAVAGGSVAKNTYLADDHDIDIFVRFSLDYAMEEELLPDLLENTLKPYEPERIHGSRDYFQFKYKGYDFEVVPVLAVEDATQAKNVTDMSPLHVEYFVRKSEGHEDEVRLTKQFCKAAGCYGAESYIRGFSGHVIDLLILHYGSFYELVKAATKWQAPVTIDLEGHHVDPVLAIDRSKHSPLLIVDPVDPKRNAAAALSQEKFEHFIERSKEFIKDPDPSYFLLAKFNEKDLIRKLDEHPGASIILHVTHPPGDKKDVAGARIKKAFEKLRYSYERFGFNILEDGWHFTFNGDSTFWFSIEQHSLPRLTERQGPPVESNEAAKRFREVHEEVYEKEGRHYAKVERQVTLPEKVPEVVKQELEESTQVTLVNYRKIEGPQ